MDGAWRRNGLSLGMGVGDKSTGKSMSDSVPLLYRCVKEHAIKLCEHHRHHENITNELSTPEGNRVRGVKTEG